ncbi:MAG: hypothetical protein ACFB00_10810 [Parvularculaceae bacterium]
MFGSLSGEFVNRGLVQSEQGLAIDAFTSGDIDPVVFRIINAEGGLIDGGISASGPGSETYEIANAGVISGVVSISLASGGALFNQAGGLIENEDGPDAVAVFAGRASAAGPVIANDGEIRGPRAVAGARYVLNNQGVIVGDVLGSNSDTYEFVANAGAIDGSVTLERGADAFENSGSVTGTVDLGEGADVYRSFGGEVAGGVELGAGDDFVLAAVGEPLAQAVAGVSGGAGLDSVGVTVEGVADVSLAGVQGFEGVAIEARFEESAATLVSDVTDQTLSVFGEGGVTNAASIAHASGDAVRIVSNDVETVSGRSAPDGPFGDTLAFINEGTIEASGGAAIRATSSAQDGRDAGAEAVENRGVVRGDVILGGGNDVYANFGETTGAVALGDGDDTYIEEGVSVGSIDLGVGDDALFSRAGATLADAVGGDGFDAIGRLVDEDGVVSLANVDAFEAAAVLVRNGATATIEADAPLQAVRLFGEGAIVNNAQVQASAAAATTAGAAAFDIVSDELSVVNNAVISGLSGVQLSGDGQTFVNNANIVGAVDPAGEVRPELLLRSQGAGNLIVNNAEISAAEGALPAVFLTAPTQNLPDAADVAVDPFSVTRFINNGVVTAVDGDALRVSNSVNVAIENFGEIASVSLRRPVGTVSLFNAADAYIGGFSTDTPSLSSELVGGFEIVNFGRIEAGGFAQDISFLEFSRTSDPSTQFVDVFVNGGEVVGSIGFFGGNDRYEQRGAGSVSGFVDGCGNFDTLAFVDVAGAIDASQFTSFERLEVGGASNLVVDDATALSAEFVEFVVASGTLGVETDLAYGGRVGSAGALRGGGSIGGDLSVAGALALEAGLNALAIEGDLVLDPTAALLFEIAGPDEFGVLDVAGDLVADDGFTLELSFLDGAEPLAGQAFNLASIGGSALFDLAFVEIVADGLGEGFAFDLGLSDGFLTLATIASPLGEVPLPGGIVLFGTAGAAWLRLRRGRRSPAA